jgi:hypothetical protein
MPQRLTVAGALQHPWLQYPYPEADGEPVQD